MFPDSSLLNPYGPRPAYRFRPWFRGIRNPNIDRSRGGIAINNGGHGLNYQTWMATLRGRSVYIQPENLSLPEVNFLTLPVGSEFISLAFDNNMQPLICYVVGKDAYLRWYDGAVSSFRTDVFENVRSPFIRIDDPRDTSLTTRDAVLSYIRNESEYFDGEAFDALCVRYFRDRFTVEYEMDYTSPKQRIYQCGMTEQYKFQYHLVWDANLLRVC